MCLTQEERDQGAILPAPVRLLCGAVAGGVAQTSAYPFDVVRRRQQVSAVASHIPTYSSTFGAFSSILKADGVRGLFVGLSVNYIKVAPATGVSFVVYEFMKKALGIGPVVQR